MGTDPQPSVFIKGYGSPKLAERLLLLPKGDRGIKNLLKPEANPNSEGIFRVRYLLTASPALPCSRVDHSGAAIFVIAVAEPNLGG